MREGVQTVRRRRRKRPRVVGERVSHLIVPFAANRRRMLAGRLDRTSASEEQKACERAVEDRFHFLGARAEVVL